MINQGVMAQPFWWDEQWTISMVHSLADVDKHLTAFEKIAPRSNRCNPNPSSKPSANRDSVTFPTGCIRESKDLMHSTVSIVS